MSNLFDSANYETTEPVKFTAGDRVAWKRTDLGSDYDPSSYDLTYTARLEGDGTKTFSISATESGTDYIIEITQVTTAAYTPGVYHWQLYITRTSDSERLTLDKGTFEVIADRANATTDPRTQVKKTLDAINATLENRASKDQKSYTILGRSLERTPIEDLLVLKDRYQQFYNQEKAAERIANGQSSGNKILTRF